MGKSLPLLSSPSAVVESVDLTEFDIIVVSTSAGKDSQAMLDHVVKMAEAAGVKDRICAVHADLGRVEWKGTKKLAADQAAAYNVPFAVVSRIGGISKGQSRTGHTLYAKGESYGDLLDQVEKRDAQLKAQGKVAPPWFSAAARYCTADFKRGPIGGYFTALAKAWKAETGETRPCRILDCIGLRAQESPARAKKENLKVRTSTKSQHVVTWLPIQDWTEDKVWEVIKASGVPYHYAYDAGMPRLSCVFCCFAPKGALMVAGKANPELLDEYIAVEEKTGFTFKNDLSLAEVKAAIAADEKANLGDWDCAA
jgi:3'-phosphoadenosine 5'-phosphosulfate sulfotransferase (PAPS reductase)/FAD synthetase